MVGTRRASTSSSTSVAHGKDLIKQIQAAIATNDHATALERLDDFKVHAATTFVGNEEDELEKAQGRGKVLKRCEEQMGVFKQQSGDTDMAVYCMIRYE